MRDLLPSDKMPATSTHWTSHSKVQQDALQQTNPPARPRLALRECTVRPRTSLSAPPAEATTELAVGFWAEIASEWRKVFSAVTIPEYIEAWMELADEGGATHWIHLGPEDMLCINMGRAAATPRIYRLRIHARRTSISFLWEQIESQSMHASQVEIILRRVGAHRCDLRLQHSGLQSWAERQLYSGIWQRSLGKLQGLLQ